MFFFKGYVIYMVGKWYFGYNKWVYISIYRGFDLFYGYYNGVEDYYIYEI